MRTFETAPSVPVVPRRSVRQVMGLVLAAMLPGIVVQAGMFGPGLLWQIAIAMTVALLLEAGMLKLRGQPLRPFLTDLSAPVTAVLFALSVPPLAPWWLAAAGMFAAIVVSKHLYGGLGHNLFNPAMVAVAVVLVAFPAEFTRWLPPAGMGGQPLPGVMDSLLAIGGGELPPPWRWDAIAQATPLDLQRTLLSQGYTLQEIRADARYAALGGEGWLWASLAFTAGGLGLVALRIVDWRTPLAVIAGAMLAALPLWLSDADRNISPLQQVFSGSLLLAAFFVASDPVSGSSTPRGRWLFGIGVGARAVVIRRWGAYPDGIAFAVLLMNCAAPLIDRHTRPRIYGEPG